MKTAEEVADEILNWMVTAGAREIPISRSEQEIAKVLTEFANEEVREDRANRTADDIYKLSYTLGRNKALEEAAKIADKQTFWTPLRIADEIRALKRKP